MLIDTHCHIYDQEFYTAEQAEEVYSRAIDEKVKMLCVGTRQPDSRVAVTFAGGHDDVWAIVGVHPHETKDGVADIGTRIRNTHPSYIDYPWEHGLHKNLRIRKAS